MTDERWEQLVADAEGGAVSRGKMFGCEGLRTGRKFFAIRWQDQLVVKLPDARRQELETAGQGEPFEPMEGRRMNGWIVLDSAADWPSLTGEARTFVESQQA
jgi:TfoX/Sxy family transcriptional regulator of competence genes